jgi:cytochrome P450
VNGETWKRHRRLTTAPFNERNSGLVWKETIKQAGGMIEEWSKAVAFGGNDLASSFMKLALHVLTSAGFGRSYEFAKGTTLVPDGHALSYRDTLAIILGDFFTSLLSYNIKAPIWMLPKTLKNMKLAQAEFKQYMVEMTEEQREYVKSGKQIAQQDNLISALIRANEMSQQEGRERYSMTDQEIYGNLFIWNLVSSICRQFYT